MTSSARLSGLDNLRAVMMWLGIVLHVSANHLSTTSNIFWRDSKTSLVADVLTALIHSFRMPVFFLLGGFFVALLMQSRGVSGMLRHRLRRLALPFALFWPLLYPLTGLLLMAFLHQMKRGTWGLDIHLLPPSPSGSLLNTMHLWFLYLLIWFCIGTAIVTAAHQRLASMWPRRLNLRAWSAPLCKMISHSQWTTILLILALSVPLAWAGASYRAGLVVPDGSFLPPLAEWAHHGLFFVVGFGLYAQRGTVLAALSLRCWSFARLGLVFFIAWLGLFEFDRLHPLSLANARLHLAFVYSVASWSLSFALIGGFVRYLPQQGKVLQYLSDSSYWVYLVHMLGTIGFGAILCNVELPALLKMAINIGLTTAVCLLSYHLFVRQSALGRLLNGKAQPTAPLKLA
jgi:fucose 4-O-acetylase-like acetyltransferase